MDEFLKRLGERIVTARQRRGWTTKELAQASDEAYSNVLRWERGEGVPNAKGLAMVARACGVTTDWLLGTVDYDVPLPAGHWIVDMALVQRLRAGDLNVSDNESIGFPIPSGAEIVDSTKFDQLVRECRAIIASKGRKR